MVQFLESNSLLPNLTEQAKPGPAQWETIETKIKRGNNDGPFTTDELTLPSGNPWNSFLRFSGVDFLSDGRAVISCLSGEVWIVDGLGEDSDTLKWTRYATGLNQPHGVKVVDDVIHVTARDQITRLYDRNGDGEADFYENFNNQVMAATNFHAFTMNLDTDSKGNFYFAKATPWPPSRNGVDAEITPHHGVLFRLPPDEADSTSSPLVYGTRTACLSVPTTKLFTATTRAIGSPPVKFIAFASEVSMDLCHQLNSNRSQPTLKNQSFGYPIS